MNIDERVRPAFEKTDFVNWYSNFSNKYQNGPSFENYEAQKVLEIFQSLQQNVNYNKSENFFKLLNKDNEISVQLNVCLKYGLVELILGITQNKERIRIGGPFSFIYKKLTDGQKVRMATFTNYDELATILTEVKELHYKLTKAIVDELKK